jgi:hypothetical protein
MLSKEDAELLTRIGPRHPSGEMRILSFCLPVGQAAGRRRARTRQAFSREFRTSREERTITGTREAKAARRSAGSVCVSRH